MKTLLTAFILAVLTFAADAQTMNHDVRFVALRLGDDEARVLEIMGVAPSEIGRHSTLGVSRTRLVFETEGSTYTVTLIADHLVDKTSVVKRSGTPPATAKKPWFSLP